MKDYIHPSKVVGPVVFPMAVVFDGVFSFENFLGFRNRLPESTHVNLMKKGGYSYVI